MIAICEHCGKRYSVDHERLPEYRCPCGGRLLHENTSAETEKIQKITTKKLISCPDCGKDISVRAIHCPNCGAPRNGCTPVTVNDFDISLGRMIKLIFCFWAAMAVILIGIGFLAGIIFAIIQNI